MWDSRSIFLPDVQTGHCRNTCLCIPVPPSTYISEPAQSSSRTQKNGTQMLILCCSCTGASQVSWNGPIRASCHVNRSIEQPHREHVTHFHQVAAPHPHVAACLFFQNRRIGFDHPRPTSHYRSSGDEAQTVMRTLTRLSPSHDQQISFAQTAAKYEDLFWAVSVLA